MRAANSTAMDKYQSSTSEGEFGELGLRHTAQTNEPVAELRHTPR